MKYIFEKTVEQMDTLVEIYQDLLDTIGYDKLSVKNTFALYELMLNNVQFFQSKLDDFF